MPRLRPRCVPIVLLLACSSADWPQAQSAPPQGGTESCFLLHELGVGEVSRGPTEACRSRVTPASTFKVPHALAALDAGVLSGPDDVLVFDGSGPWPESSRRDHTLASAVRHSVVWYFQSLATKLGPAREQEYVRRLAFGNMDSSSGLTTFWIGGSLLIAPEEQLAFWIKLYENTLPVTPAAVAAVKAILVEPSGKVVNAAGEQPFGPPWPPSTIVSAKPGAATDRSGRGVKWLVGHVATNGRAFIFVSCVIGPPGSLDANAAIDLASRSLRASNVL